MLVSRHHQKTKLKVLMILDNHHRRNRSFIAHLKILEVFFYYVARHFASNIIQKIRWIIYIFHSYLNFLKIAMSKLLVTCLNLLQKLRVEQIRKARNCGLIGKVKEFFS